jgi:hypothetical protein
MIPQFTIFPLEGTDKYEFSLQVNLNLNWSKSLIWTCNVIHKRK